MPSETLGSVALIEQPKSSILCDGGIINNIVDEFGVNVVLRQVTKTFSDEYGDANESYSDQRVVAMMNKYSANDEEVKEGIFQHGEVTFTFKNDMLPYLQPGARILFDNQWYEIRSFDKQSAGQITYMVEVRVQKI
jgi:hypothetical protein